MKHKDLIEKLAKEHHLEEKIRDLLPIIEAFDERSELFQILQSDAEIADRNIRQQPNNQYLRRTLIRTHFAMIEGLLNVLNQTVLDIYEGGFIQLTAKELEKLNETRMKDGESRPNFMSITKKLVFSFGIFARTQGGFEYPIDTQTDAWKQFEDAVIVRNRLMHPRKLEDMMLSEKEISLVIGVATWFVTLYADLQSKAGEATTKRPLENLIKARIKGTQAGKQGKG